MAEVNPHFTFMLRGFDFAEPSLLISFSEPPSPWCCDSRSSPACYRPSKCHPARPILRGIPSVGCGECRGGGAFAGRAQFAQPKFAAPGCASLLRDPLPADDGTARIEPLAHKTPTDIDAYLRQAVVDAVKKNRDEIRETATLPHIER